jgi:hypothetical protein
MMQFPITSRAWSRLKTTWAEVQLEKSKLQLDHAYKEYWSRKKAVQDLKHMESQSDGSLSKDT